MRLKPSIFSSAVSVEPLQSQWPALLASFVSMLLIVWMSSLITPGAVSMLIVASVGASAMLVFLLPNSPVSQPYPLLMGHVISAVVGVTCALLPLDLAFKASLCVFFCLLLMVLFDCVHPPGGATGLMPVIVGAEAVGAYTYPVFPVLINMLVLVVLGIAFHRYYLKKEYPSVPISTQDSVHLHNDASPLARLGINHQDLENALSVYEAQLNITGKDLTQVYGLAQQNAYARKFGEICCEDIMSKDVVAVLPDTELEEAWALLRKHKVKVLPVLDSDRKVIGIISLVDFLKRAGLKDYDSFAEHLIRFVKNDSDIRDGKPKQVKQIMASPAYTVKGGELIAAIVPLLSDKGLHHIPVVNNDGMLEGMVTQSDLIAALYFGALNAG